MSSSSNLPKDCPKCGKKLDLKQINLDSALYMCPDLQCPYPVGDNCVEVARKYTEMRRKKQGKKKSEVKSLEPTKEEPGQNQGNSQDLLDNLLSGIDSQPAVNVQELDDFLSELLN